VQAFISDLHSRGGCQVAERDCRNLSLWVFEWSEIAKEQTEFVDQVTNELLERMLPFRTTEIRLAHLMQHLANHSTYHRGQVALMMRQLPSEPAATDFHVFLAEGRRGGAT